MNKTLKNVFIYAAKNAVNAALLSLVPVYHNAHAYSLHTRSGLMHVGELVAWAVIVREGMIFIPKIWKWSETTDEKI